MTACEDRVCSPWPHVTSTVTCGRPAGHVGMHGCAVTAPGEPDRLVQWFEDEPETEAA